MNTVQGMGAIEDFGSYGVGFMPLSELSDEGLVRLIVDGDEESFNELIRRYTGKIYNLAMRITNNHNDAEDVVQEVCISLYKKAHTFRHGSKFSTWLYRLVTNESITRIRQNNRYRTESLDNYMPTFDEEGQHRERPVADWSQDVENKVAEKELHAILEKALNLLSPLDRSVVVLSEVEELTNPEICEVTGLTLQAVKGRLHRTRLVLRGMLEEIIA